MKGQNFRQLYESLGPQGTVEKITACLNEGELKPSDFSLKELFIGCCGHEAFNRLGERIAGRHGLNRSPAPVYHRFSENAQHVSQLNREGGVQYLNGQQFGLMESESRWTEDPGTTLREAGEAVDVSAFSAITGQIAFNAIGQGWKNAQYIGDRLFKNYPTPFSGEKIPWISNVFASAGLVGDSDIHPVMPYPEATLGPRYVTSPRVLKKGAILSLSLEFILFDRTAQAMQSFEKLGEGVRYDKEYAQLRVFAGYNPIGPLTTLSTGANQYTLNGSGFATYLNTGSNYINAAAGFPLVDWTTINEAIYLRSQILDPDTGRPITMGPPKCLLVMPQNMMTAKRILHATNTQTVFPAYSASVTNPPGNVKFDSANPVDWQMDLYTSPILFQILLAASVSPASAGTGSPASPLGSPTVVNGYTWVGDFQESFWYAETFPFRTEQAAPNNIRQFEQDVEMRFKVSEMGTPFCYDPRYTQFLYNT